MRRTPSAYYRGSAMPMTWVPPGVAVEFLGVTVYHVYKNQDLNRQMRFWYTTDVDEGNVDAQFDVRDLHRFFYKELKEHSESWAAFANSGDLAPNHILVLAIEAGVLTQNGISGLRSESADPDSE